MIQTAAEAIVEPSGSVIYPVVCPACGLAQGVRMAGPITVIAGFSCTACGEASLFQAAAA